MGWVMYQPSIYKIILSRVFSNAVHMLRASAFIVIAAHVSLFSGAEKEHRVLMYTKGPCTVSLTVKYQCYRKD